MLPAVVMTMYLPMLATGVGTGLVVENWRGDVASRWANVGAPCWDVDSGILRMRCQSAGIVSRQALDLSEPVTVSGTFRGRAAVYQKWYAGAAIWLDDGRDSLYGSAAIGQGVPPFHRLPYAVSGALFDDNWPWVLERGVSGWDWHEWNITRWPDGEYRVGVDGEMVLHRGGTAPGDWRVFLLCVSVGENTLDDGSLAECEFGPVTVRER